MPGWVRLYKRSIGREFARKWMKKFGEERGIEGIKLLSKSGQLVYRRLDDRKRHELANLYTSTLKDMFAEDAILGAKGVLISKIEVPSVFNELLVYWQCYGDNRDQELSALLDVHSHAVRTRLSEVLYGAKVPALKFIPDRRHIVEQEMNRLFKAADYGVPYQTLSRTAATWGSVMDDPPPRLVEEKEEEERRRNDKIADPDRVPPFVVRLQARIEEERVAKRAAATTTTTTQAHEQTTAGVEERRDQHPNDGACA